MAEVTGAYDDYSGDWSEDMNDGDVSSCNTGTAASAGGNGCNFAWWYVGWWWCFA